MRVGVCGIGVVSAAGLDAGSNFRSLCGKHSGVGKLTLFGSAHDVPVGEVKAGNTDLRAMLGLAEREISRTALLGMLAARQALGDAESKHGRLPDVGLVSSTSVGGMDLTERFYRDFRSDNAAGDMDMVRGHSCGDSTRKIAAYCGIDGFTTTISTACSSAPNAIMLGAELIERGLARRVVVGGTDSLCAFTLNGFSSLMILDHDPCRPFDATRAGLNLGEGAAYLVLQDGDTLTTEPYCWLTGWANANDAHHQTASSENGEGARLAMKGALERAGISPADVGYVNAHGTGTSNNDLAESIAFRRIFGTEMPAFSSTKPFTGHALAAAGGIEAVFSVLALTTGTLYPNLNFISPIEGGYIPVTQYERGVDIKHVLSNSFGFGGNCSTLIFSAL